MLRIKLTVLALLGAAVAPAAWADESAHTVSFNIGVTNNYIFRGISQTENDPAVQGGADYAHASGAYLGTWASNVSDDQYFGGNIEWDVYGGFKKTVGDFGFDVGALAYIYPGADEVSPGQDLETVELYASGSWKWFSLKYSHSVTDFFGVPDSDGSGYLDLSATVPLGVEGLNLIAHYGSQQVAHNSSLDYTDFKVGASYAWKNVTFTAAYTGNDLDPALVNGEDINDDAFVISAVATF